MSRQRHPLLCVQVGIAADSPASLARQPRPPASVNSERLIQILRSCVYSPERSPVPKVTQYQRSDAHPGLSSPLPSLQQGSAVSSGGLAADGPEQRQHHVADHPAQRPGGAEGPGGRRLHAPRQNESHLTASQPAGFNRSQGHRSHFSP